MKYQFGSRLSGKSFTQMIELKMNIDKVSVAGTCRFADR